MTAWPLIQSGRYGSWPVNDWFTLAYIGIVVAFVLFTLFHDLD